MPVTAHLLPEHCLVVSKFYGVLTDDLLVRYYDKLLSLPGDSGMFHELVDFRELTRVELTRIAMSQVARKVTAKYGACGTTLKCAVIASLDCAFGMSRMYEMGERHSNIEVQVFRDAKGAVDWLGLSESNLLEALNGLSNQSSSALFRVPD